MRFKLLGHSGLRVSELCLGTMTFCEDWGWGASKEDSRKMFDCYRERGGNFIDTSVNYTGGTSETFLGDFIHPDRDYWVVATKYSLMPSEGTDPNQGGNHRKNLRQSVERSLRRLQTDYLDLLYLHMWDFFTPVDEVLRGLDDVVRQGKVNYIAISDTPAWIVAEANTRAEMHGWSRFIGLQVPYSLRNRSIERAELPMAAHWDMAVLPFGLVGSGLLTGKYLKEDGTPRRMKLSYPLPLEAVSLIETIQAVAREAERTPAQVAINWVRQQQSQAQIIPILGARTVEQLEDNLACLEWELSPDHLERLSDASKITLDFPLAWLNGAKENVYGQTFDLIDQHPVRRFPKI